MSVKMIGVTVRRARVSGINKQRRVLKGSVYVPKCWLGKKVFVIEKNDVLEMVRSLKAYRTKLNAIRRMIDAN